MDAAAAMRPDEAGVTVIAIPVLNLDGERELAATVGLGGVPAANVR